MTDTAPAAPTAEDVAQRLFASTLATAETMSVYLGERLGWYAALAEHGPLTADALAVHTDTHPRYAREWLEMQAAYGLLDVDLAPDPPVFSMSSATAEVMCDASSVNYLGPLPRMFAASFGHLPHLLEAYRTGGGVSWRALGADARECQAALNRPWFDARLAPALAGVAHVHDRLRRPGARIADIGCGAGWSSIALAGAYPDLRVEAFDIDDATVDMARRNVADAGLDDQITVTGADAAGLATRGPFDLVFAFECVHDMPQPVEVLTAARDALAPDGSMIVMDEAVSDEFAGAADELDRIMYGFSLFVCLPDGMSSQPSVGTGTVMRPSTLTGYAVDAGFGSVDVLPIDDFSFFRFYELHVPG